MQWQKGCLENTVLMLYCEIFCVSQLHKDNWNQSLFTVLIEKKTSENHAMTQYMPQYGMKSLFLSVLVLLFPLLRSMVIYFDHIDNLTTAH